MKSYKAEFEAFIEDLQNRICAELEEIDGSAQFKEDIWDRPGGGGGQTRVLEEGKVIEKGGVNISKVWGELPEAAQKQLKQDPGYFFACGISLVIHPRNPHAPTVHANFRYFEIRNDEHSEVRDMWFGGGSDLTPYYVYEEDCVHFHTQQKLASDPFGDSFYPKYKLACDEYFKNHHRGEHRGIGGVFFDYLKPDNGMDYETAYQFTTAMGNAFLPAYSPILRKRKFMPFTEEQKDWQEIRRGRYVEFNLIHDKGTLFGLRTNGRIESIFMSLPAHVQWRYDYHPKAGTPEAETLEVLTHPRNWIPINQTVE